MYDENLKLKDAGVVTSSGYGTVDGSAQVLNLGSGLVRGNVIFDISTVVIDDDDEKYELHLMGGDDASFTNTVSLCCLELGANASLQGNQDTERARYILPFQNEQAGTIYPYVRVRHVVSGTSPKLRYAAYLGKDLELCGTTNVTAVTTTTTTTSTSSSSSSSTSTSTTTA
jgi:hypothetical protein